MLAEEGTAAKGNQAEDKVNAGVVQRYLNQANQ